jgi:hypothetical protein
MKTKIKLITIVLLFPLLGFNQNLHHVDFISPFNDGLAAVEKNGQWGFINEEGTLVIPFRSDLVTLKAEGQDYPIFQNDRCLINIKKKGIKFFGYIDKSGKKIIEPQFLNATHFNNGIAIVLELVKSNVGNNQMLKKPIVSYDYFEAIIDTNGKIQHYLVETPIHITFSKEYLVETPIITSKFISDHLIAKWSKDKKWEIIKIEL